MKNTIKISESSLKRIISESVMGFLRENEDDKQMLIDRICDKYSNESDAGWPGEFNEWIPVEAYISHIDGRTATANVRIGDTMKNGGTGIEEEVSLEDLPVETLRKILMQ